MSAPFFLTKWLIFKTADHTFGCVGLSTGERTTVRHVTHHALPFDYETLALSAFHLEIDKLDVWAYCMCFNSPKDSTEM